MEGNDGPGIREGSTVGKKILFFFSKKPRRFFGHFGSDGCGFPASLFSIGYPIIRVYNISYPAAPRAGKEGALSFSAALL